MTPQLAASEFCTSCYACIAVCRNNAIMMTENREGFSEPSVDSERCAHCGLCEKRVR
jgi:ferredoxin